MKTTQTEAGPGKTQNTFNLAVNSLHNVDKDKGVTSHIWGCHNIVCGCYFLVFLMSGVLLLRALA